MNRVLLLILLGTCNTCLSEPIGRLFFSPAERIQLEQARDKAARSDLGVVPTIGGIVSRSDGKDTIWLDGVPYSANALQSARARSLGSETSVVMRSESVSTSKRIDSSSTRKSARPR